MTIAGKNEFVELKYTGYSNNQMFDSNIKEDLDAVKSEAKPRMTIVRIGNGMVVPGLDKALEGKEIGKEYEVIVNAKEGFGDRKPNLVKMVPLKEFTSRKINPMPGMMFTMDDNLVKVIAVSGGRVSLDFNNPMAGKELKYKFIIVRKVDSDREKVSAVFDWLIRLTPEFEVRDKIVIKGPAVLQSIVKAFSARFKEMIGKELDFELKELPKEVVNAGKEEKKES